MQRVRCLCPALTAPCSPLPRVPLPLPAGTRCPCSTPPPPPSAPSWPAETSTSSSTSAQVQGARQGLAGASRVGACEGWWTWRHTVYSIPRERPASLQDRHAIHRPAHPRACTHACSPRRRTSLRILGTVGEPINPEAWRWYYEVSKQGRAPAGRARERAGPVALRRRGRRRAGAPPLAGSAPLPPPCASCSRLPPPPLPAPRCRRLSATATCLLWTPGGRRRRART